MPPRRTTTSVRSSPDTAEQTGLRFIATRDRTEAQLREHLLRKGVSGSAAEEVVARCVERGYINDEVYAVRWGRARLTRHPMGRARLEAELLGQGLRRTMVLAAVDEILGEQTEAELARKLLRRKGGTNKGSTRSASALLRRHGFSEETIEEVMKDEV